MTMEIWKPGVGLPIEPGITGMHRVVADEKDRLGLAVAVVDDEAGTVLPLLDDLGIEGLAGAGAVPQAGQVVLLQVFENQESVDRRRGAEGGDPELAEDVECDLGVEAALGVVLDYRRALSPLARRACRRLSWPTRCRRLSTACRLSVGRARIWR